ncbi:hypothetical protein PG984_015951 [Apiospora sp. TS-2023a]
MPKNNMSWVPPPEGFSPDEVQDGKHDIAMTTYGKRMRTEASRRVPLQPLYLWTLSKTAGAQATNMPFVKKDHGPPAHYAGPKVASVEETQAPDESATPYIEVGLFLGGLDNPGKYGNAQGGRKAKEGQDGRDMILDRDPLAMRVFTPISPNITSQVKYYVGWGYQDGRLFPAVIKKDHIFFYPEFWYGIHDTQEAAPSLNAKAAKAKIAESVKWFTAVEKKPAVAETAELTPDALAKMLAKTPLVATAAEDVASKLVLFKYLYDRSGNVQYLKSMKEVLTDASPMLQFGPHTPDSGTDAFFVFKEKLTDKEAQDTIDELQKSSPAIRVEIDPEMLKKAHEVLRGPGEGEDEYLGDALPPSALGFFVDMLHRHAEVETPKQVADGVQFALAAAEVHAAHTPAVAPPPFDDWTASKQAKGPSPSHKADAELHLVLCTVCSMLEAIAKRGDDAFRVIAKEHGAVLKHASLDSIMDKIGEAIDVETLKSLCNQLGALHAAMQGAVGKQQSDDLRALQRMLREVMVEVKPEAEEQV